MRKIKRKMKRILNIIIPWLIFLGIYCSSENTTFFNTISNTIDSVFKNTFFTGNETNIISESGLVKRIVDGDTLVVTVDDAEKKVRLIGIDTPESVHSNEDKNTVWGTYASEHTKTLVKEGQTIFLEYDEETEDQYGRTLAYVWLSEDKTDLNNMLNAKLLADGYAMDKVYMPNCKYASEFENIRITAQENGTGLWSETDFLELWN